MLYNVNVLKCHFSLVYLCVGVIVRDQVEAIVVVNGPSLRVQPEDKDYLWP